MKLFRAIPQENGGYEIAIERTGLWVIVAILTLWGFAVHVADRMIFG